ncbi:MAG: hypothetical protein R3F29_06720 [Planctomycetota bacterium]
MLVRLHVMCAGLAMALPLAFASAQTVHLVGPGGFAQIGAAIAAAAPGDIVRVAAGTYAEFVCDKGVTIVAMPGAQVDIAPSTGSANQSVTRFQLPAGHSARVRGLHFTSPLSLLSMATYVIDSTVAFESCTFAANLVSDDLLRVQNGAVWLRDCTLDVGQLSWPVPALRADNSRVAAVDCTFRGNRLAPDGFFGAGHGIDASASDLHLVGCTVSGGDTMFLSCFYPAGDALRLANGSRAWLADSTLTGGDGNGNCGPGGTALRNLGPAAVHLTRTTLVPGGGNPNGLASVGPTVADTLIGLAAPSQPAIVGAPYAVAWRTTPGDVLFVLLSLELVPAPPAVTVEATWLSPPQSFWFATLVADVTGTATLQTGVPNTASLRDVGMWLTAVDLATSPWHVAPPIGGTLH